MDTGSKNGGNPVESEYLTPGEAAELLKVTKRTIYTWCQSGKIEARMFGRSWRIDRKALRENQA